jgi:site-specific DNA recombinase
LDEVVWNEMVRLLEDPGLIQTEINRRLQAIQDSAPTQRRKEMLQKECTRLRKGIDRLLDAYQEELISLEALRKRMPALQKREQTLQSELDALEAATVDQQSYLRIADSLDAFLSQLRTRADTLQVTDRQKTVRLLVNEILVDQNSITIRHSIPMAGGAAPTSEPQVGNQKPGYLLRSGSHQPAAGEHLSSLHPRPVVYPTISQGLRWRSAIDSLRRRLCATKAHRRTKSTVQLCCIVGSSKAAMQVEASNHRKLRR